MSACGGCAEDEKAASARRHFDGWFEEFWPVEGLPVVPWLAGMRRDAWLAMALPNRVGAIENPRVVWPFGQVDPELCSDPLGAMITEIIVTAWIVAWCDAIGASVVEYVHSDRDTCRFDYYCHSPAAGPIIPFPFIPVDDPRDPNTQLGEILGKMGQ